MDTQEIRLSNVLNKEVTTINILKSSSKSVLFIFFIDEPEIKLPIDACNPSPCGPNTNCNDGVCSCISNYLGDAYQGCRPECTMNTECAPTKACVNNRCKDPCPGICGQNAKCDVHNHIPSCSCPPRYRGDPFVSCREMPVIGKIR